MQRQYDMDLRHRMKKVELDNTPSATFLCILMFYTDDMDILHANILQRMRSK